MLVCGVSKLSRLTEPPHTVAVNAVVGEFVWAKTAGLENVNIAE